MSKLPKQQIGEAYRAVSGIVLRRLPLKEKAPSTSDVKDTLRKSTQTLYLLVKKPRKHHAYQFPQGGQDPGETASEAALRELREECGSDLKVKLIDKSPIGIYQYKFPPKFNRWDNSIGAKVNNNLIRFRFMDPIYANFKGFFFTGI
jgi:8-oxo-dGTP pyrophosphatase MutT (NUDIX family)